MVTALLVLASTEGEETSKTAFYVAGLALVAWALIVSALGIVSEERFKGSTGPRNAVCLISAVLAAAAMATAVITG